MKTYIGIQDKEENRGGSVSVRLVADISSGYISLLPSDNIDNILEVESTVNLHLLPSIVVVTINDKSQTKSDIVCISNPNEAGLFPVVQLTGREKSELLNPLTDHITFSDGRRNLEQNHVFVKFGNFMAGPYEIRTAITRGQYALAPKYPFGELKGFDRDSYMIYPSNQNQFDGTADMWMLPKPAQKPIVRNFGLKPPYTLQEQISKLKYNGLIIEDEAHVKQYLARIPYYSFVGYAKLIRDHTSIDAELRFQDVAAVADLDSALREVLGPPLLELESFLRTVIADEFARLHCREPNFDQHYDLNSYKNQTVAKEILDNIDSHRASYENLEWMQHHTVKYGGRYPLWVMVRLMSFSTLSRFYACMYDRRQNGGISDAHQIAAVITGDKNFAPDKMKNILRSLSFLRNRVTHLGRMYDALRNIHLPKQVDPDLQIANNSLFAHALILLRMLPTEEKKDDFQANLGAVLDNYSDCVDLSLIGVPRSHISSYKEIIQNNRGRAVIKDKDNRPEINFY